MISTIIGALLPTAATLLLGLVAGWHHDFDIKKATVLNSMVMLYALPLSLFSGMVGMSRDQVLSQCPLAFAILLGMAGGYAVVFVISHYLFRRDLVTASLQALAIAGPAVPFIGASILGHLFGASSAVPISVAGLVMNLIQVPATLMLASAGVAQKDSTPTAEQPSLGGHIVHALRQPVVWAPLLALALILCNLHFPKSLEDSLELLGSATGGVALFASGIVVYSFRVAFNLTVGVAAIARNIVIPAAIWGLMLLLHTEKEIMREAVLTLAIPTASIPVILAVQYQVAEQEMAAILFFSTIFSIVTMGGFIWLTACTIEARSGKRRCMLPYPLSTCSRREDLLGCIDRMDGRRPRSDLALIEGGPMANLPFPSMSCRLHPSPAPVSTDFASEMVCQRAAACRTAARSRFLNRRAWHVAVGAEHAAITCLRLQEHPTAFALVKELARVRWHRLRLAMTAGGAGDCRGRLHQAILITCNSTGSI